MPVSKPVWGPQPEQVTNDKLNQMMEYSEQVAGGDLFGEDAATTNGLQWGHAAGRVRDGSTLTEVAAGTLNLPGSTANIYIEVSRLGAVSFNTAGFSADQKPIRRVTTDAGSITASDDRRVDFDFTVSGGAGGVLSGSYPNPAFAVDMATQAELDTHTAVTNPHSATSAATASRLVLRDASGRAQFADPAADADAATRGWVNTAIAALVDTAPATLDTLNELAAALGDDPNFATTVTNSLAGKLSIASNLGDLDNTTTARTNLGLGNVDNTSDANKPISTLTQTALDAKASLTGAVFTGAVDVRDLFRIIASGVPVPCVHWVDEDVTVSDFTGVGFTPNLGLNTIGRAFEHSGANGGFNFSGFSANSVGAVAMTVTGHHGSQTPNVAPVRLQSYKWDGGTGRAALSGTEPLIDLFNGTSAVSRFLGNGSLGIGVTTITARLHLGAGSAAVNSAPQKFTSGPFQTVNEAGTTQYNNRFALVESDLTLRYIVQSADAALVTGGAPYANNGYKVVTVNGVDYKFMTTA